jgi:hypothetical protein
MNSVVIGDNKYKLPSDYTIEEYIQLHNIGWDNKILFMSTAFNIPKEEIELLPNEQLELGGSLVYSLLYPQGHTKAYKPLNFKEFTLGQFVDCEMMTDAGYKKILELCQLLFKEKITKDTPMSKVFTGYQSYITYRNLLYYQYKGLFGIDDDNDEVVEIQQSKTVNNGHVWYDLIATLAQDNFLQMNEVVKRPVVECFNFLAYMKDKKKKELQETKRQQQMKKLQRA